MRVDGRMLAASGLATGAVAAAVDPSIAQVAARQAAPAFVLVAALLAIGAVVDRCGLFEAAGHALGRYCRGGGLTAAGLLLVAAVTAVLNLDTSVAFLTPVIVTAASVDGADLELAAYGVLAMANSASLLLPGSNLTNLIVAGSGGAGLSGHLLGPWLASVAVTLVFVLVLAPSAGHRNGERLTPRPPPRTASRRPLAAGLALTVATGVAVVASGRPAIAAAVVAIVATAVSLAMRLTTPEALRRALGLGQLVGLFGCCVAVGTAAHHLVAPAHLLARASPARTATIGALSATALHNLPATVLLTAHPVARPEALVIGLDLGPNLAVTGSLAALIWLRQARAAGATPSVAAITRRGLVLVPLSIGAALAVLR